MALEKQKFSSFLLAFFLNSLLFISLSLLLLFWLPLPEGHKDVDSTTYLSIATTFQQKDILIDSRLPGQLPLEVIGYPLLIGTFFKFFGNSLIPVIIVQLLLGVGILLLSMLFGRRFGGKQLTLIVGLCTALDLGLLIFSQLIMAEILLVFLLLLMMERLLTWLTLQRYYVLWQAGIAGGLSVLVKPAALFFPLLIVMLLVCWLKKRSVISVAVFLLSFYTPAFCYALRNKLRYNTWQLSRVMQVNCYNLFLPKLMPYVDEQERTKIKQVAALTDQQKQQLFKKIIVNHPIAAGYVWFINVCKTMVGLFSTHLKLMVGSTIKPGEHSFFKMHGLLLQRVKTYIFEGSPTMLITIVALLEACWNVIRLFFVFAGLLLLYRYKRYNELILLIMYCGYFVMITGTDGCARLRMMIEPILILLAACGIMLLYNTAEQGIQIWQKKRLLLVQDRQG